MSDVNAEHDSTTVVLELFNTIDTAVEAARNIASARLDALKASGGGTAKDAVVPADYDLSKQNIFLLTEKTWIKPGFYRLNKPWEQEGGICATGRGLLAKLGLDTITTTELVPSTSLPAAKP